MMKKVKKKNLPKYAGGTISASKLDAAMAGKFNAPTNFSSSQKMATMDQHRRAISNPGVGSSAGKSGGGNGFSMPTGIVTSANESLKQAFGVDSNSEVGVWADETAKFTELGGSIMPGWGHFAGAVVGTAVGLTKKGSVDEQGNIQYGGLFGRSKKSLEAEAGRKKASIVAREQTQNIQADYYNDPNVEIQPDVLAAEGGIMRKPVKALVSKGELIYDPETKKLMKVPGSKGKPNKKDDVMVQLAEGDIVLSNSPDLMIGDKTISDFVSGLVNHNIKKRSKGTQDAVEANIKKALAMQEGMKARRDIKKKHDVRGILKAADGDPDVDEPITEKEERELLRKLNISVNPNYNKNINHSRELAKSSWYSSGDKKKYSQAGEAIAEWLKNNPTELAKAKAELSNLPQMKKHLNKGVDFIDAVVKNVSDGLYGQVHDYFNIYNEPTEINPNILNWAKNEADSRISKYAPVIKPLSTKVTAMQIDPTEEVEEQTLPEFGKSKKSINWNKLNDNLYKAASVLTPLFDREKAEPVQYQVPIAKYRSTAVNVDPQLRAIDESYALARYNQTNINPSTGAGMAYGLQAAANRAKQRSYVYNWQTNAQNELIGKNVDTYNRWSENYAGIMNDVYDKAAANRATARNINRQNKATALKNWGSILRNDKQYAMDRVRMEALDPMLKYGYQNDAELRRLIQEQIG